MHQTSATVNPQIRCTHTHPAGQRCGSFALRGQSFCYHHHPERPASHRERATRTTAPFVLPPLFSPQAIRIAIAEIAIRIADNTLDTKRAGLLLQCIQTAAAAATHST
jgi:hypothetical protein